MWQCVPTACAASTPGRMSGTGRHSHTGTQTHLRAEEMGLSSRMYWVALCVCVYMHVCVCMCPVIIASKVQSAMFISLSIHHGYTCIVTMYVFITAYYNLYVGSYGNCESAKIMHLKN